MLPAIEGASEFLVANRGDHIVVNYMVNTPDTFPPVPSAGGSAKSRAEKSRLKAIRRECRGMIFDAETGDIIRRPYHKFFNLNQVAETQIDKVDLAEPHDILEKLDGSMIVPYNIRGTNRVVWGTKMGDTDVATPVHEFVKNNPQYLRAFVMAGVDGKSLIFEWMSRKQRIVIDHPEDRLVLTAIRNTITGEYDTYHQMEHFARLCDLDVVQRFHVDERTDINDIMDFIRSQEGTEGVVIRFHNGHMIKIKSEWYSAIHGAKELITEEKNVVQMIIDQRLDDTKALVLEEDRLNLDRYERDFWKRVDKYVNELRVTLSLRYNQFYDRKMYALEQSKHDHDYIRNTVFRFFDEGTEGVDLREHVIDRFIRPNLGTRTKFAVMKQIIFPGQRLYL